MRINRFDLHESNRKDNRYSKFSTSAHTKAPYQPLRKHKDENVYDKIEACIDYVTDLSIYALSRHPRVVHFFDGRAF